MLRRAPKRLNFQKLELSFICHLTIIKEWRASAKGEHAGRTSSVRGVLRRRNEGCPPAFDRRRPFAQQPGGRKAPGHGSASAGVPPQTWREPVKLFKPLTLAAAIAAAATVSAHALDISGA